MDGKYLLWFLFTYGLTAVFMYLVLAHGDKFIPQSWHLDKVRHRILCKVIYYLLGVCGIVLLAYLSYRDILGHNYSPLFVAVLITLGKGLKLI